MSAPSTPQKQAQSVKLEQLPTPPPTAVARKETTDTVTHHFRESGPHVRRLTYDAHVTQKVEKVDDSSDPTLHDEDSVKQAHTQQLDKNGRPQSEVKLWLSNPSNPEERRRRFDIFLRGLWPSNEKFNTARNPLYDPEEDGPYEFFLHQNWDGHCPWFDDDYDPNTDPSKSNEVWEPKIGEEGIENEQDIRMVIKAREEQRVRSEAFKERKAQVIAAQERAGIKYGDMDMLQVFWGPEIESNDADSDYTSESDNEEGDEISVPAVQIKTQSTTTDSALPGKPTLQPMITAKGIRVFGGQEPSNDRSQSRGSKNKKGRKAKKRRRPNDNPNSTYKYTSASEDEQRLYKKAKKGKFAIGPVSGDSMWKAQTRSAARRAQHVGTDGTYEMD